MLRRGTGRISTNLEQGNEIRIRITESRPFLDERGHKNVDVSLVVERGTDGVGEGSDRVVENEEVLLLVLVEGVDEISEYRTEEGLEFRSCLLFQRRERRATRLLNPLVVVEAHLEELRSRKEG